MPTLTPPRDDIEEERQENEDDFAPEMQEQLSQQARRIFQTIGFTREIPARDFWTNENTVMAAFLVSHLLGFTEAAIAQQVTSVLTPAGLGLSADVNARAARWANQHALQLARGLNGTTRDITRVRLANWLQQATQEMSVLEDSLAQSIAPRWRAEMIAQTEVTHAWSAARQEIAEEYDVIKGLQWVTVLDERVCPICRPLHGTRRTVNGVYPGGLQSPAAHPRCRCGEVFVV